MNLEQRNMDLMTFDIEKRLADLEAVVDQLKRRERFRDEFHAWLDGHIPDEAVQAREKELRAKHGVAPIAETGTERPRWFKGPHYTREYPSRRVWSDATGFLLGFCDPNSMEDCIREGHIELDGPPPHGKPLAKQAKANASEVCSTPAPQPAPSAEDGIEERAQSVWQSPKNDGRGWPVLFVEFARSEVARVTAQLRADLAAVTAERDALRARAKKPRTPAKKRKSRKGGKRG